MKGLARYFPILEWGREYNAATFADDMIAAVIVTIMLIPQSLAYALLAGMPPEAGLYASIAPLIVYAIFGASRALAVGPVAVISLMTATAIGRIAEPGSIDYLTAAFTLAVLSGIFLFLLGLFRLGSLANLLSHPVVTGFVAASGVLIAASQVRHILGIGGGGENFVAIVVSIAEHIKELNIRTTIIGVGTIIFLFWARKGLKPLLLKTGMKEGAAGMAAKTAPVI
ncbi:MAG TPA: SulP family inorganic anion transporter, partial [Parvularculaceae bacterium]|nr:SulP family inorganic anion transporter [Parvularculaceae bacterium]